MIGQAWSFMWDHNHGPDWNYETDLALARLNAWRSDILSSRSKAFKMCLLEEMCANQKVFNGFGRHTAHDCLHLLRIFPGEPPFLVCEDDVVFARFKAGVISYMAQWVSPSYRERVASLQNHVNPLAFYYRSDANFINQYMHVFRKWRVRVPSAEYNAFVSEGLLDEEHTIGLHVALASVYLSTDSVNTPGLPYDCDPACLVNMSDPKAPAWKWVDVFVYKQGSSKAYSVIRAQRPEEWKWTYGPGVSTTNWCHSFSNDDPTVRSLPMM